MLSSINKQLQDAVEYYETHEDYLSNYADNLGDLLQYEARYTEDDIYAILDSSLSFDTDYSYLDTPEAVATIAVGEIHHEIETTLTRAEYDAIELDFDYASDYSNDGTITFYVCSGMNVNIYSDYKVERVA